MTLRLRMIVGLVLLVTIGLAIFGFSTYGLYSRSEYNRLDDQLHNTVPLVSHDLFENAGFVGNLPGGGNGGAGGPRGVPYGTYGELRDATGAVVRGSPTNTTGSTATG